MKKFLSVSCMLLIMAFQSGAYAAESENLPDGSSVQGERLTFSDGSYYIGQTKDGVAHGPGAIFLKGGSISLGIFKNGKAHGRHKFFAGINGLVSYIEYDNGKPGKTYGELDGLLANGDYEGFYKKRGDKVFVGIALKSENNLITVDSVLKNSPADLAGLRKGDKITAINGTKIVGWSVPDTLKHLVGLAFGKKADFSVERPEALLTISFVPGVIPKNYQGAESTASLLWKKVSQINTVAAYQDYLDTVTDTTYHQQAKEKLHR